VCYGRGKSGVWWNKLLDGQREWQRFCPGGFNKWQPLRIRITAIRQEHLQNMSREDCVAEGIGSYTFAMGIMSENPPDKRWKFIKLWDSINTRKGTRWEDNPRVWVLTFEVLDSLSE
jgi:hypothetical protein